MRRRKVLIIDDDEVHLIAARELLEYEGLEVATHQYGFGATQAIARQQPDLVLLDVNMPALSGESLVGILSRYDSTRSTPVVFYSSNDEDTLRAAARQHGAAGYICKGDVEELRRKVFELLGAP